MSGFEVGDVVECIKECDGGIPVTWEPKVGGVYRVWDVEWDVIDLFEDPARGDPEGAWAAECFRKIDRADDDFVCLMRACKPRVREPA